MERNELEKGGLFNAFRGSDRSEGEIPIERLMQLRQEILEIKAGLGSDKVLPGKDFIREIGNRGFGCIQLLQQCQFPQINHKRYGSFYQPLYPWIPPKNSTMIIYCRYNSFYFFNFFNNKESTSNLLK